MIRQLLHQIQLNKEDDNLKLTNPHAEERVIFANCGGDGSLMRIIKEFSEEKIDLTHSEILFVTLPFGTANDLPRAFGWGKEPSSRMLRDVYSVIEDLDKAVEEHFNVWEIWIVMRDSG